MTHYNLQPVTDEIVLDLNQLKKLADEKRSVYTSYGTLRPEPASWVINYPGMVLHQYFRHQALRVYTPKKKKVSYKNLKDKRCVVSLQK